MPYTIDSPPEAVKGLPKHAIEIFVAAFNSAFAEYKGDEGRSAAVAWAAVKAKFEKNAKGEWVAKESIQEGGEGSGNFGHAGIPGEVGGSAPGGGGGSAPSGVGKGDERYYNRIVNEGGEGYNPITAAREKRELEADIARDKGRSTDPAYRREKIERELASTDWDNQLNREKVTRLRQEHTQTYIDEGWTKEVTGTRREAWNAAGRSGKYTNSKGQITWKDKVRLEHDIGFSFDSLKDAISAHGM